MENHDKKTFHLAGIVPVAGGGVDFGFEWSDCMMPIAPNYTAVERAVVECAWAGCETIWIICNDDVSPLIRHRMGDFILDPVWANRSFDRFPSESKKIIPIFYVPIHPKDRGKRDSLGWSVLHGALTAFKIAAKMSRWLIPSRYYVAFPYGVYNPDILRQHRKKISSSEPFYLLYDNKTIRDGEYLGFTFDKDDFVKFRRVVREGTGFWDPDSDRRDGRYPTKSLPIEERYSARHFTLDKIFNCVILDNAEVISLPWYFNIDCWDRYCNYMGSKEREKIIKPTKLLNARKLNSIGEYINEHDS
tara:strand:+ start:788 stop:1696 length:909 start_codon:yes stop_codon:yes gene_type:complete